MKVFNRPMARCVALSRVVPHSVLLKNEVLQQQRWWPGLMFVQVVVKTRGSRKQSWLISQVEEGESMPRLYV